MTVPFEYPARVGRRHDPRGYRRYQLYRPWLRDEFAFRCGYCLQREQWGRLTGEFDSDHFLPRALRPDLAKDYGNLVYCCRTCNQIKGDSMLPDPVVVMTAGRVGVKLDGSIHGADDEVEQVIDVLGLDSDRYRQWRLIWIRNVALAREYDPVQHRRLLGFPDDLPDLRSLRPPAGNGRPDGIQDSYFWLKERGELPAIY